MSRVLFCAIGQLGHLNPMITLARHVAAAGHDVRVATGPDMAGHVAHAGFPHLPIGAPGELRPEEFTEERGRRLIAELTPRWIGDLSRHVARWRPDVVVRQWLEGASMVVAAREGIPQVVVEVCLRLPPEYAVYHPALEIARAYGVDPAALDGDLWLSCYPPSFARPGTPRLPHEHHVKPLLYDLVAAGGSGGLLGTLPDGPVVYATLGTMYNMATTVFARLAEAFAGQPYHAVITTGPDCDPASVLPSPPPNVRLARYVPHSLIFERCAAVISHGGFNTVMCALAERLPLGLIPLGSDHGTNARRCAALGAAVVYPGCVEEPYLHVAPQDVDPDVVREMTASLLSDGRYRAAAARVAEETAALPGPGHAAALIDDLLAQPGSSVLRQNAAE
ncbi:glycosyltransferase [Sphaerisporangium rubeum]|uniref:UDP:flavonoid glycosyltransferase YjiC (YdhE family) n=1 Tax=Sphaerisporangium rubeum TaxID=321317 RepID=A0A7X0IJ41_9ACTN|nr:glycosyltransferase [Sphaerisporangium rubeum]MBB6474928.1 UDP:flavonoid glycosyltransferase YjiC (YdhE family) [Sphaerisporangium rubeum]